ncbi:MAG: Alkaline phosphatase synthesis sensor protein PhoR [Pelotomaculum sp. PtaB.Bin117]|nr:MAG: Alkaline phosphatase synthesis sensor protein PhoR [Pelotomaculum sp. PtaB.Bin117]OPY63982.1 MAG: Alkaline phosphatase synthesis sensor protein PhoR [Pelotomaculum sp. PtaU1.Bin065]
MSPVAKPFLGIGWRPLISYFFLFLGFLALAQLYALHKPILWEMGVVVFISAAILAWITYRRLINPIEEMSSIAQDMARGNLEQEIRIFAQDETGDLARSINYLSRELKKNIDDVISEKNKVQAILASMCDGVIAMDNWGRVILVNPIVEKFFGTTQEASKGKNIRRVIRNSDFEKVLNQFLETGRPVQKQIQLMTPEPRLFRVQVTPLMDTGVDGGGMVALLRDFTGRKKLEEMRSEFVANVSHELRTPLTSIKGFTETLLDGALEDAQTTKHFLEIIYVESERLTRLIDELLNLSKIEDHKVAPDWQPVSMHELMERTVAIFKPRAAEKDLNIEVVLPEKLPMVHGDPDMLGQVLINLIDNAVSYTQNGGMIRVSAQSSGDKVKVEVQDNGIGIPEDSISRVFERFYRVDKARSREQGGTGLGLSIVKHIIDVHHGNVQVKSKVGEGSTFTFELPVNGHNTSTVV